MQPAAHPPILAYLISGLVIVVVLYFRARRMSRSRSLKLETLWIVPAIFLALAGFTLFESPPRLGDIPWLIAALLIGGALGWQRGRLMKIWVAPDSGQLTMQGSPWALVFLAALILIRFLVRSGLDMEAQSWALSPALINDGSVIFALGLFGVMRAEMALRAAKLSKAATGVAG